MGIKSGLWVSLLIYRDSFEPLPYFKGTIGEPQEHSRNIIGIFRNMRTLVGIFL